MKSHHLAGLLLVASLSTPATGFARSPTPDAAVARQPAPADPSPLVPTRKGHASSGTVDRALIIGGASMVLVGVPSMIVGASQRDEGSGATWPSAVFGTPLLVGGAVLTLVGAPLVVWGAVRMAEGSDEPAARVVVGPTSAAATGSF